MTLLLSVSLEGTVMRYIICGCAENYLWLCVTLSGVARNIICGRTLHNFWLCVIIFVVVRNIISGCALHYL